MSTSQNAKNSIARHIAVEGLTSLVNLGNSIKSLKNTIDFDHPHESLERVLAQINAIESLSEIIFNEDKEKELTLKTSRKKLKILADKTPYATYMKTYDGTYIIVNGVFAKRLDKHFNDIIGKTDFDLFTPELAKKNQALEEKALLTGEVTNNEAELNSEAGNGPFIFKTIIPIKDSADNVTDIIGVIEDVTEIRNINRKLSKKQIFISATVHDTTNAMAAALANIEFMQEKCDNDEELIPTDFNQVKNVLENAIRALDNALHTSLFDDEYIKPNKSNINVLKFVHGLFNDYKVIVQKGGMILKLLSECDEDAIINTDGELLARAVYNLISNAIKYGNGSSSDEIILKTTHVDNVLTIAVQDRGIGVAEKYQQSIFNLCETTANTSNASHLHSHGLGLFSAKSIIQSLGGTIDVASKMGEGSTFFVQLPMS